MTELRLTGETSVYCSEGEWKMDIYALKSRPRFTSKVCSKIIVCLLESASNERLALADLLLQRF